MKLVLLDQFSELGGAQQVLLALLPAMRERGWDVLVGLPGTGELFERCRALGVETARISSGPFSSGRKPLADGVRFLAQTPRLARQIRELAAAASLVSINGPRLLPAASLAGLGAPVLFYSHSYLGAGPQQNLAAAALRRLDPWVLGVCNFVTRPWREVARRDRISVIYNGVGGPDAPLFRGPHDVPRIGCIGRIAPEKGQREFVAAAAIIRRGLPRSRFLIYGAPRFPDARALRYAEKVRAAAGAEVEFPGWADDVNAALADLDLLLVPSAAQEATTRVIPEAFAAGIPVVAFRSGGIPEVVDDGYTGFLAGGVQEMAEISIRLLTGDPERLAAVSRAARERWRQEFALEKWRQQVLDWMQGCA